MMCKGGDENPLPVRYSETDATSTRRGIPWFMRGQQSSKKSRLHDNRALWVSTGTTLPCGRPASRYKNPVGTSRAGKGHMGRSVEVHMVGRYHGSHPHFMTAIVRAHRCLRISSPTGPNGM